MTGAPFHASLEDGKPRSLLIVLSAYMMLVVLAFAINLIPPLSRLL